MPHIAEHELLEYLDRELDAGRRADVERHVLDCPACAAGLDALQTVSQALTAALQEFDVSPGYDMDSVIARGRGRGQRHLVALRALARAAVLVFVVGGAAAAAIPGSPVRVWMSDAWSSARSALGLAVEAQSPAQSPSERPRIDSRSAGIAVPLVNGQIRIDLREAAADALVRISITAGPDAAVTAEGASYRTGSGWIEIHGGGPGTINIEIPERAVSAVVSVDGAPKVLKDGAGLRLATTPAGSPQSELQFRVQR